MSTINMGRYCRICGRIRANERFSGAGRRAHICSTCKKLPKDTLRAIEAMAEITGFLFRQSHISGKNLKRLQELSASEDPKIAKMAAAVLAVATVTPYRRKRFRRLARDHRPLIHELVEVGLLARREPEEVFGDELDDLDDPWLGEPSPESGDWTAGW